MNRRQAVTVAVALGIVIAAATPAGAHVEVSAEGAQAGTGPVTLSFSAESESSAVGIVGMRTQLPSGIAPADVSLAGGPAGWVLTPTADGFELAGADLGPGVDAEYSVTVARLPADVTELVFPTLQRYADGREDAWIEPVTADIPDPAMPAPALTVAPAPPEATAAPSSSAAPSTAAASSTAGSSTTAQPQTAGDPVEAESNTGTVALVVGLLVIAAVGAGAWWWRTRRAG